MPRAYYNEFDPYAAQWLRNLSDAGLIAPGDVDDRDIRDVHPNDLIGYTQCHFFAGIGIWSGALRAAGWPDERPVWTGSCPCQPFSASGRKAGFADERHLWPHFFHLILERQPETIMGEQVASPDGLAWLDLVQSDLEGTRHAFGAVDLCAAGVGAPNIRQRLFWIAERLADFKGERRKRFEAPAGTAGRQIAETDSGAGRMACADGGNAAAERQQCGGQYGLFAADGSALREGREGSRPELSGRGAARWMGDTDSARTPPRLSKTLERQERQSSLFDDGSDRLLRSSEGQPILGTLEKLGRRPTDGAWRDADWLHCRDGKWRPVEPQPQQMANGDSDFVGTVCSETAAEAEKEVMDVASGHKVNAAEALRLLRQCLRAEAVSIGEAGGLFPLYGAPVLLTFLRELGEQRRIFCDAGAEGRAETSNVAVRALRLDPQSSCAPLRRESAQQFAPELADALCLLSQKVASFAEKEWCEPLRAYAGKGFPLNDGDTNRVGKLRAYGNAVNFEVTKTAIVAYLETCM